MKVQSDRRHRFAKKKAGSGRIDADHSHLLYRQTAVTVCLQHLPGSMLTPAGLFPLKLRVPLVPAYHPKIAFDLDPNLLLQELQSRSRQILEVAGGLRCPILSEVTSVQDMTAQPVLATIFSNSHQYPRLPVR